MIKFEKVSLEQFTKDCKRLGWCDGDTDKITAAYDAIVMPERSTWGSAGYDIRTPFRLSLQKYSISDYVTRTATIPTGIRVKMPKDVYLSIKPRSGLGFKYGLFLYNTEGVIDSDYYNSSNEGHIMIKLCARSSFDIEAGDRIVQGVFNQYLTTSDDSANGSRDGGFGSTGV